MQLHISIEAAWVQSQLDVVEPVVSLPFIANASVPGLYEINQGKPYSLSLKNDEPIEVWAALTPASHVVFQLRYQGKSWLQLRLQGEFHLQQRLPDGCCYQFYFQREDSQQSHN